jgi:hypothetical protein
MFSTGVVLKHCVTLAVMFYHGYWNVAMCGTTLVAVMALTTRIKTKESCLSWSIQGIVGRIWQSELPIAMSHCVYGMNPPFSILFFLLNIHKQEWELNGFFWLHCKQTITYHILRPCDVLKNVRDKVHTLKRTHFVRSCGLSLNDIIFCKSHLL